MGCQPRCDVTYIRTVVVVVVVGIEYYYVDAVQWALYIVSLKEGSKLRSYILL